MSEKTENEKTEVALPVDSRLSIWSDRGSVKEIAERIRMMIPGGKKLSISEALALAQGAIAHDLDPFNGEIWYIPGSGLMTGIKGLRKAARKQVQGNFWTEFEEIQDPEERKDLLIPDEALAYKCLLRDSETIRSFSEAWRTLRDDGIPIETIPDIIGSRPYALGIGYYKKGEATRMTPVQVAMKRAEADALKRRFDLPFAVPTEPNGAMIIEGSYEEFVQDGEDEEEPMDEFKSIYPVEDRQENQWEQPILEKIEDLQLTAARKYTVNILKLSPFVDVPYGKLELPEVIAYFVGWLETKKQNPKLDTEARIPIVHESWADEAIRAEWLSKALNLLGEEE